MLPTIDQSLKQIKDAPTSYQNFWTTPLLSEELHQRLEVWVQVKDIVRHSKLNVDRSRLSRHILQYHRPMYLAVSDPETDKQRRLISTWSWIFWRFCPLNLTWGGDIRPIFANFTILIFNSKTIFKTIFQILKVV